MSNETKHIIDIISDSIDSIRATNTISSITLIAPNTYTIVFDEENKYAVNDYLTLGNNKNVEVISLIDDYTINVSNLDSTDLSLETETKANAPYFSYDHWESEAADLLIKSQAINHKDQKYPLVFLLLNIKENRQERSSNFSKVDDINLYLITETNPREISASWRHENTFPILRELYVNFMMSLVDNQYLNISKNYISHNYEELFFLGTKDKKQNKLNDYVDAIRLTLNDIKIKDLNKC